MKIILKITVLCLVLVTLFVAFGCDKTEISPKTCDVENPLTDLAWLKEVVDVFEYDATTLGYNPHARIYQCRYKNGIGFLLEMCVGCPDYGYWFRNCEGESLCVFGGITGNLCAEFEIDFENKQLIWEKQESIMNNFCEFDNPLNDLLWLKAIVDEITLLYQDSPLHISIYQCTYGDGKTGFLMDKGNIRSFYNCEGEILCEMGGVAGATCPDELQIDFENKTLIWEINN